MVTTVTIPSEKARPQDYLVASDEQEFLCHCRRSLDSTQAFLDDPTQDKLVNMGAGPGKLIFPKLSPEEIEAKIKVGVGTCGIHTVVEPADLELYRSYMYSLLTMPDTPEVAISMLDINMRGDELTRYQEGRIAVKARCPDGIESWLMVSVPVPTLLMCWMGIVWGWPKYVADIMTVTPTRAEVIYEGDVRLSMEFTSGPVDNDAELRDRGKFEGESVINFRLHKGVPAWSAGEGGKA